MQDKKSQALWILGLDPGATPKQVKSAYRKEAIRTHPDKKGLQKDFELVKQAYNYLVKHGTKISAGTVPQPEITFPASAWQENSGFRVHYGSSGFGSFGCVFVVRHTA